MGRRRYRRGLISALALVVSLLTIGCSPTRSYDVKGRVAGFSDDGRRIIIEHEDVPGLMPAMTMPFKVASGERIDALEVGDAVQFTLVLSRDSTWIHTIRMLPDSAVALHPAGDPSPPQVLATASPLLAPGDVVPSVTLVDQDGSPFNLEDYRGRTFLLTFIYTRCPLPDYCPLMSQRFQQLQPHIVEKYGDTVRLLSVSFDTDYDTPEVLRRYAAKYTRDPRQWTFATGSADQIARLTSAFGVAYIENGNTFDHNLATALVDAEGRVRHIWRGNDWTSEDVLQVLDDVINPTSP